MTELRAHSFAQFVGTSNRVYLERQRVITEARTWLGTAFHHGARLKGVGVDCGQLVLAVYTATGMLPPVDPGTYPPSFAATEGGDGFIARLADEHCDAIRVDEASDGDVVVFWLGRVRSHLGLIVGSRSDGPDVLHAHPIRGVVVDPFGAYQAFEKRIQSAWRLKRWNWAAGVDGLANAGGG